MQPDFYVDTHMSSEYSCRLLSSWSVEDAAFSPTFQQGKNATAFTALRGSVGLKTLTLPLHFFGKTAAEAVEQKSRFLALLLDGIHALQMPDGFLYRAALESFGKAEAITPDGTILSCEFTLQGQRCRHLQTHTLPAGGGTLYIEGTHPSMDCRLTVRVGKAASSYNMAGTLWTEVNTGDVLVLDGLNKLMTKNGANAVLSNNATGWPKLHPGANVLSAPDALTVEYYPVFL